MATVLLPDVEQAVIAYLGAHPDITAITSNVAGDINGPYPMLRVQRTGGPGSRRLDHALLFIDAYGDTPDNRASDERATLSLLSRTALAVLYELEADGVVGTCDVSAVEPVVTNQWLPDPLTNQGRYHSVVAVYARTRK